MVKMNEEAIKYIKDIMGYDDVVLQVVTYKTWCDPPKPEVSVSFTDDSTEYYRNGDYIIDDSPIGKVFIPKKDIDIVGEVGIRYEKHPWIEQFEFDGLHPRRPLREGYGLRQAKSFAESLSKIYNKAYDDYAAMCSETLVNEENEDGLDIDAYFSNAAESFICNAGEADTTRMLRKFCGFTENMWREGTKTMHDVALKTILPIIENDSEARDIFYETITPEFREYINENGYNRRNCS